MRRLRVALVLGRARAWRSAAEWVSYAPASSTRRWPTWPSAGRCWAVGWWRGIVVRRSRVGPLMAAAGVAWFLGSFWPAALYLHRGPLVHALLVVSERPPDASAWAGWSWRRRMSTARSSRWPQPGRRRSCSVPRSWSRRSTATCGEVGPRRRARVVATVGAAGARAGARVRRGRAAGGMGAVEATLWAYEVVLVVVARRLARRPAARPLVAGRGDRPGGRSRRAVGSRSRCATGSPARSATARSSSASGSGRARLRRRSGPAVRASRPRARAARSRRSTSEGERVAVLVHDRAVLDDPALVEAVAAATRIAVANVRLQAEVQARVEQLAASRRRIVEAADAQRRRLERELHEGAERRLAAVSAHVEALAHDVDEPRARALLADVEDAARRGPRGAERAGARDPPAGADDRRAGRGARRARPPRAGPGRAQRGRRALPRRRRGGRVLRVRRGADERRQVRARVARADRACSATRRGSWLTIADDGVGRRRPGPRLGPARARRSRRGARRTAQRREPARRGHPARRRDPGRRDAPQRGVADAAARAWPSQRAGETLPSTGASVSWSR